MYFQVSRSSPGKRTESLADPGRGVEVRQQRADEVWLEKEQAALGLQLAHRELLLQLQEATPAIQIHLLTNFTGPVCQRRQGRQGQSQLQCGLFQVLACEPLGFLIKIMPLRKG